MNISITPKVSVCVVTYNQEQYIRKCLQSIVEQITNFDFEVLVADDCSTDGTRMIVQEFVERYPGVVKLFFREKNIGPYLNFVSIHQEASGEYIAHVDGDDYCLPGKLQAQSDFLIRNPDCNVVWHRMYILYQDEMKIYEDNYSNIGLTKMNFFLDDVICNITIGLHSSKMYRKSCVFVLPEISDLPPALDFTTHVAQLNMPGKYASFVSDVPYGVYRSNLGISRQQAKIRIAIYGWLLYFYKTSVTDRRIVNAKIAWMLMSDIKHFERSMLFGFYAFISTIRSVSLTKILWVRSKMYPSSLKFKISSSEV